MMRQKFHRGDRVHVSAHYSNGMYGDGTPIPSPYSGKLAKVVGSYLDIVDKKVIAGLASLDECARTYKLRFFEEYSGLGDTNGVSWFDERNLTHDQDVHGRRTSW